MSGRGAAVVRRGVPALFVALALAAPLPGLAESEEDYWRGLIGTGVPDGDARHLEPGDPWEEGGLGGYQKRVTAYLHEAYEKDVVLRVVVYPSFHPEYVVGIRQGEGGAVIFRIAPQQSLWGYSMQALLESGAIVEVGPDGDHKAEGPLKELKARYPDSPGNIPKDRCERPIDTALAAQIRALWKAMILDARTPPGISLGADGVIYHFSMPLAGGVPAQAHIWSPPKSSRTGQLVEIADRMERYCQAGEPDAEREGELEAAVAALATGLERAAATASPGSR